jgi:uncharacterized protein (DUF2126 family)
MSSPWGVRIAEGFVVGISATVAWFIFTSMNEARIELNETRDILLVQMELNQELYDEKTSLEGKIDRLDTKIDRLNVRINSRDSDRPTVGSAPTEGPTEVTPTSDVEYSSNESLRVFDGEPLSTIQQKIDYQRKTLTK